MPSSRASGAGYGSTGDTGHGGSAGCGGTGGTGHGGRSPGLRFWGMWGRDRMEAGEQPTLAPAARVPIPGRAWQPRTGPMTCRPKSLSGSNRGWGLEAKLGRPQNPESSIHLGLAWPCSPRCPHFPTWRPHCSMASTLPPWHPHCPLLRPHYPPPHPHCIHAAPTASTLFTAPMWVGCCL